MKLGQHFHQVVCDLFTAALCHGSDGNLVAAVCIALCGRYVDEVAVGNLAYEGHFKGRAAFYLLTVLMEHFVRNGGKGNVTQSHGGHGNLQIALLGIDMGNGEVILADLNLACFGGGHIVFQNQSILY